MPQGHSQSPHTTSISKANISLSFSNSTTFHVLLSIPCPLLSSPSKASTTHCQLKLTPSSLQEPLGCCWGEGALCRPCHTIADALSLVAGPMPLTKPT
ncbi:hypothetical protein Celaphus_00012681, partial [Cervus elaphus hippelaphus]